jgi:hypothetical protein
MIAQNCPAEVRVNRCFFAPYCSARSQNQLTFLQRCVSYRWLDCRLCCVCQSDWLT